jgi:UDP:flavonoid glycosyltransferase YjiC (YdhE family)
MSEITPEALVKLISRAMEDSRIRDGLARMKQAIARENGLATCVEFVEGYAQSRRSEHMVCDRSRVSPA